MAAVGAGSASAATTTLANSKPDGLIPSTGNLYWTSDSHVVRLSGAIYTGHVWRASKSNVPGQERQLYSESETFPVDFESITWALVDGQYYGYFVANYPSLGISQIKQVSLAGGAAATLATSPSSIGSRDLVNDGSFLYWADAGGIRRMAITGGPVTTLVSGTGFTHLGLDDTRVYYTSGKQIMSVAKTGGSPTVFYTTTSAVEAFTVLPQGSDTIVYWGEADGAVKSYPFIYGYPYVYQNPTPGVTISSVALGYVSGANWVMWGQCTPVGCGAQMYDQGSTISWSTASRPIDLSADQGGAYWGDSHLEKYPF
jgi:hypothetical protein